MNLEYFIILMAFLGMALYLKKKYKLKIYDDRNDRIAIMVFFVVAVIWDSYAIMNGHWYFQNENLFGITIGVMPIEEYAFALIVPFWIIAVYKTINKRFK